MDNSPKTISFRPDEGTLEKLERLRTEILEERGLNNSDILRFAVDFLYKNYNKEHLYGDDIMEIIFSYIKATYLLAPRINFGWLDDILYALEHVFQEYDSDAVKEIASLYNEYEPITVARIIRFKYRETPCTFLRLMGISKVQYENLSDDELADFIMQKFTEEEFRKEAKRLFRITV